jgi:phage tail sheath protein FI
VTSAGTYPTLRTHPSTASRVDWIGRELRESLGWTASQPNGEALWRAVRQDATALLESLWRRGELVGATAGQAFFVRCDETTMTAADVARGHLVLRVGIATLRPAEFEPIQIDRQVGQPLRRSPTEE